ncbi:hypothetical protein FB192DRAFT_1382567 [Mucor lusitanicus]|uniref:Uncharacterized protein n=1 Tax=Mucor circinelloides f. lusitanicus TaxID=29924 RepID=A0A8H4F0Z4_MUCCL|nr:hypothetical protein FB192DRAFT_1382567 [Mucor lusitanicus]
MQQSIVFWLAVVVVDAIKIWYNGPGSIVIAVVVVERKQIVLIIEIRNSVVNVVGLFRIGKALLLLIGWHNEPMRRWITERQEIKQRVEIAGRSRSSVMSLMIEVWHIVQYGVQALKGRCMVLV